MYKIFAKDKCVYLVDNKALFVGKSDTRILEYQNPEQLFKIISDNPDIFNIVGVYQYGTNDQ